MELKEEWRPVKGYENIIEVSNFENENDKVVAVWELKD